VCKTLDVLFSPNEPDNFSGQSFIVNCHSIFLLVLNNLFIIYLLYEYIIHYYPYFKILVLHKYFIYFCAFYPNILFDAIIKLWFIEVIFIL